MKPMTTLARVLSVVTSVAVLSACGSKPVVGILLPMTGEASSYGESMKNGIDIALDQAKDNLPKGFRAVWGDTGSDPPTGAAELRRMAGEGIKMVVAGTTSDTAHALLPLLDELDLIAVFIFRIERDVNFIQCTDTQIWIAISIDWNFSEIHNFRAFVFIRNHDHLIISSDLSDFHTVSEFFH